VDSAVSVDGVPIRLTSERWFHIVENHDDMGGHYDDVLETIASPEAVMRGYRDTLIAVRGHGRRRHLMVIYRQVSDRDGFVITAFFSAKVDRGKAIWKRP
jgi:hypothetical protein